MMEMEEIVDESFWKDRRILITGINGFVGSHLSELLIKLGAKLYGFVRRHAVPYFPNINALLENGNVDLTHGNLLDLPSILQVIRDKEPEIVFHLGAQSFVPTSVSSPIESYNHNIIGTANVLEAIRLSESVEKMQFAGSSEEYGLVLEDEVPIKETNPLRPLSPYAVSKVAGDLMCFTHYKNYNIPVVRTRAFNHTGPRRGSQFVLSQISNSVASGKVNGASEMVLGNLEPVRDFTDVRDTIRGYMLAIEKGTPGDVYNFGSGKGYSIGEIAEMAIEKGGLSGKMKIVQDPKRYRKADVMVLICDATKAREELGWTNQIPIEKTIEDIIEYHVARTKRA
ncbi:MAG: GDP-mannose 4,6-dehydratase [Candidatus Hodarchaeota archaeon]